MGTDSPVDTAEERLQAWRRVQLKDQVSIRPLGAPVYALFCADNKPGLVWGEVNERWGWGGGDWGAEGVKVGRRKWRKKRQGHSLKESKERAAGPGPECVDLRDCLPSLIPGRE